MDIIKDSEMTQMAQRIFLDYDFEMEYLPGVEYIKTLDTVTTFYEYTKKYASRLAKKRRVDTDLSDAGKLVSFIVKCSGNKKNGISRQTLMNWLTKDGPANSMAGRENVYKLCFALEMNVEEAKEFFLKAYLERPFNYKNIHEAVFFFCMVKGWDYDKAIDIIDKIEAVPMIDNPEAEENTEEIGRIIEHISTEEKFIEFVCKNRSGFEVQNKTATQEIQRLLGECMELAAEEHAMFCDDEQVVKIKTIDKLLSHIYGYSARGTAMVEDDNGNKIIKKKFDKSISDSEFPKLIKRNFPQRQQFEEIDKGRASFDVIRKALIMLCFYRFFVEAEINGGNSGDLFDEFKIYVNTVLAQCGYIQMYWGNPFDWMIGYCAKSPNPIDELRELINVLYLECFWEDEE